MIETVIRPRRSWLRLDVGELVQYRDLLLLLVRRDFVSKYKQTILGPAWFVIQPVLTTLVFTVVFGSVAKIPTDGVPPTLFYLCGLLGWNYFAQTLNATGNTFTNNSQIFGKVYFPRLVVPLALVISNLLALGIQLGVFLIFYAHFRWNVGTPLSLDSTILLFPVVVIHSGVLALGAGLWISALTAKYKDFSHLLGFLTQLWMFATPVIYPLSQIPDKWRWLAIANPMAPVVEIYKRMFLGTGTVEPWHYGISWAITVIVTVTGLLFFQRVERTVVDTV
ncbi:MAG TPA: ABC transporter permease [Opitutaceae bacterium]|nr:ABC transporter permease [Opitutaceae bacterium]